MEGLVEISELRDLLGYSDKRTIVAWLKKVNAPMVILGRNTYTQLQFLDELVKGKLRSDGSPKYVSDFMSKNKQLESEDATSSGRKRRRAWHSAASATLLKNINSADELK